MMPRDIWAPCRILIAGGPGVGKTTLAHRTAVYDWGRAPEAVVRSTDELVGVLKWGEDSAEVATWMDDPGPWVIEGSCVMRAIRKWHERHPGQAPPFDRLILLTKPYAEQGKGQVALSKGILTVYKEIEEWLKQNGIKTELPL